MQPKLHTMFKRKHKPDLKEIHQYVEDLEAITNLRDRAAQDQDLRDEVDRYDTTIEVMQQVLIMLNEVK